MSWPDLGVVAGSTRTSGIVGHPTRSCRGKYEQKLEILLGLSPLFSRQTRPAQSDDELVPFNGTFLAGDILQCQCTQVYMGGGGAVPGQAMQCWFAARKTDKPYEFRPGGNKYFSRS